MGRRRRRRRVMDSKLRGPGGPTKTKPKRTILCTSTVTSAAPSNSSELSRPTLPPMSSNCGLTEQGGKKQPARACKSGTTSDFWFTFKNIVIMAHARSLEILTGKGAAACQYGGVNCTACSVAEVPDTGSSTQRLLQMPRDIVTHEITY